MSCSAQDLRMSSVQITARAEINIACDMVRGTRRSRRTSRKLIVNFRPFSFFFFLILPVLYILKRVRRG